MPGYQADKELEALKGTRAQLLTAHARALAALAAGLREYGASFDAFDKAHVKWDREDDAERVGLIARTDGHVGHHQPRVADLRVEEQRCYRQIEAIDATIASTMRRIIPESLAKAMHPMTLVAIITPERAKLMMSGDAEARDVRPALEARLQHRAACVRGGYSPLDDTFFHVPLLESAADRGLLPCRNSHHSEWPPLDAGAHAFVEWCRRASDGEVFPEDVVAQHRKSFARVRAIAAQGWRSILEFDQAEQREQREQRLSSGGGSVVGPVGARIFQ